MVTYNNSTNDYGPSSFIVGTSGNANYLTIALAITAAAAAVAAGTYTSVTVFIRPGTYTENLTLQPNVNLAAWGSDSYNGTVTILGKATFTQAGTVSIFGIELKTNSDFCLAVTGSAASVVYLDNCFLNCSNNTGISFTSSSASATINIYNCLSNLGTTGIALYSHSSAGNIFILDSNLTNTGNSTTPSSNSSGLVYIQESSGSIVFSTTSTGVCNILSSNFNTSAINTALLTTAGTGTSVINQTNATTGTASSVSVGTGTTVNISGVVFESSNTNVITGLGTCKYIGTSFVGSSQGVNVTTQSGSGPIQGLKNTVSANTAAAGFIGELMTSTGSSVSLSNNTPTNIGTVNLTAGIWDVSCMCSIGMSGAFTQQIVMINSTSASTSGLTAGINGIINQLSGSTLTLGISIMPQRITLTTTTSYYLVAMATFSTGTSAGTGKISATRVG